MVGLSGIECKTLGIVCIVRLIKASLGNGFVKLEIARPVSKLAYARIG